jgi:hypothetical protein
MAVLPDIEGLEVTIEVDGETAKEYDPCDDGDGDPPADLKFHIPDGQREADGKPYLVKYIEAKPGAPFHFHIKRLPNFHHHSHHIAFCCRVDSLVTQWKHDNTVTARDKKTTWRKEIKGWDRYYEEDKTFRTCYFRFEKLHIG